MKKAMKILVSALCVGVTTAGAIGGTIASMSTRAENTPEKASTSVNVPTETKKLPVATPVADNGQNNPLAFSSAIRAVTPYEGATMNFNTREINAWWNCDGVDLTYLNSLYEYTVGHKEFLTAVNDNSKAGVTRLVEIYKENDVFQPVNNTLKWSDDLDGVASYTVRISLDRQFTQTVQKVENADKAKGVALQNPLMDTEYYWQVIANLENGGKTYSPIFSVKTEASVRTVEIEGVSNTRDLGGFESVYGYVQQGLVYRSARLETMTEAGKKAFNSLGIKSDLDLRGESEAGKAPNTSDPMNLGDQYFVYTTPMYSSDNKEATSGSGINNGANWENIKNIMTVFADKNNYPIDMHCAVGRDRTGTMSILLKALLGASEEDAKKDYYTSMFATTGAWEKGTTATQSVVVDNIFAYLNTFEGATLADKTASFLITKCGMAQSDIDAIRNIMVGAEGYEVETIKTFADEDNYADYAFVTFENYGVKTQTTAVKIGEKAVAPYALVDGATWGVNGEEFDFDTAITEDITLTATTVEYCSVTVKSIVSGESYTVEVVKGSALDFSTLEKNGTVAMVITEDGEIVTSYTVEKDCVLNVLYTN